VLRYNNHTNGATFNELLITLIEFIGLKPATPNQALESGLVYYNGSAWLNSYDDSPA
jgi:hypothetical protein